MYPISLCMIVRDEARNLPATLAAVQPFVAEIIVLDTGSTDDTVAIAERFGAKVYHAEWRNDFSWARNLGFTYATSDYILVLDADEILQPGSAPAIGEFLKKAAGTTLAGRFEFDAPTESNRVHRYHSVRLFPNNSGFQYEGTVHEQLMHHGRTPGTLDIAARVLHNGYTKEACEAKDKFTRNLTLLEGQLKDDPGNPYLHYQQGKTCFVGKRYEQALTALQAALDLLIESPEEAAFLPDLLTSMAYCIIHLKRWNELPLVISEGIQLFPECTDLYFAYACGLIEELNPTTVDQIPLVLHQCLKLGEADSTRYDTTRGVGSFLAHYNLGVYYEVTGQANQAEEHYTQALRQGYTPAGGRLTQLRERIHR